jgi:propionyl-CoA carboxylase alpha chain
MRRALDQFYIEGISHNIDFLAALVSHPRFGEGRLSTNFIHEEFGSRFDASDGEHDNPKLFAAVAATIHHLIANRDAQLVSRDLDGETIDRFRFAVSNDWVAVVGNDHFPVAMTTRDGGVDVTIESESFRVRTQWNPSDPIFHGRVNGYGVSMMVKRTGAGYRLTHGGCQYEVKVMSPRAAELLGRMPPKRVERTDKFLLAPMPGLLMNIRVEVGQDIRAGDPVAVIEAMKMENQLLAESDGVVAKIHAQVGESVKLDDPIVEFE